MKKLHIFKPGKHTTSDGRTLSFSEPTVQQTANVYDKSLQQAPIVVGHPRENHPAYGWIKALEYTEDGLEAIPEQVEPEFQKMVNDGRFKTVSASFYHPESKSNPAPGSYYLRHVGFLGAVPPAVKGLKTPSFSEDEEGVIEFSEPYTTGVIASLFRKVREWVIAKDGVEEADKILPDYLIQDLEDEARKPPDDPESTTNSFNEDPSMKKTIEELQAELDAEKAAKEKLKSEVASFSEEAKAAKKRLAEAAHAANVEFAEGAVKEKKIAPSMKDRLVEFMDGLHSEETVIEFSDGDKKTKTSAADFVRELISARPAHDVSFRELSGDDGDATSGDENEYDITNKALEFQAQQRQKGIEINISDAVAHVTKNLGK